MYAGLKSILENVEIKEEDRDKKTKFTQIHKPCGYAFKRVCCCDCKHSGEIEYARPDFNIIDRSW